MTSPGKHSWREFTGSVSAAGDAVAGAGLIHVRSEFRLGGGKDFPGSVPLLQCVLAVSFKNILPAEVGCQFPVHVILGIGRQGGKIFGVDEVTERITEQSFAKIQFPQRTPLAIDRSPGHEIRRECLGASDA